MSQNKFFKYVRNYFVSLPLSHYIAHFLPIIYGGIFIIAIFQLCISGVKNHYTFDVILIEAAIVLPISMILVPLILWVINTWWILFDAFRQAFSEFSFIFIISTAFIGLGSMLEIILFLTIGFFIL